MARTPTGPVDPRMPVGQRGRPARLGGPLPDVVVGRATSAAIPPPAMSPAAQEWLAGLRHSGGRRPAGATVPGVDDPAAVEAERHILAEHLSAWLDNLPHVLASRRARRHAGGGEPEAALVITTSPVGILVADAALAGDDAATRSLRARTACVTEVDYRAWCMRHPDHEHAFHVNHWSWVKTRVPRQRDAEFARHPLRPGERYWLHRLGTSGSGAADFSTTHLWKFDGRRAVLLEASVQERFAPRSAP